MKINKKLQEKINESLVSVLPITIIIFLRSITFVLIPIGTTIMFLVGAVLLVVGMGFFSLGADMAMMPMGEGLGTQLFKMHKLWLIVIVGFLMGFLITVAEPDLQVLARQVPSIPDTVLICTVAVGVGIFLVLAILRILFRITLSQMLLIFYFLLFVVAAFAPRDFVPVAFDSGGVTTGPITVPFIMALGLGLAATRGDKNSQEDSFGLIALCSVGPILAVLLLGIAFNPSDATYTAVVAPVVETTRDVALQYAHEAPEYIKEVLTALVPLCFFFLLFQLATKRYSRVQLVRIGVGFVYTLIGLICFLTGVNVGFIPVGHLIGSQIGASQYAWALVPLGMVISYYIVNAEPAVHVLNRQVEEVTNGAISQKSMRLALSVGIACSLALSMIRILSGLSIFWLLIPGYGIAIAITFFVPKIFTGIAFDSGGVASGPMTSTFLLPFAMGACESYGGNVLTDAFGVVAMVAMTPLITIQIMGLIYARQAKAARQIDAIVIPGGDEIVEYGEESADE